MKKLSIATVIIGMSLGLMACGGPSDEKIEQAQLKFNELVEAHNKTVEAHLEVVDNYLDQDLAALADEVTAMRDYNLIELTEEEIDVIIEEMNSTIKKYEATIVQLIEKKQQEADAALIEVPLTIHNQTGKELKQLYLFSQGTEQGENVLNDSVSLGVGEILTGLYIYKDIENIPWEMVLSDGDGNVWELEITTEDLDGDGRVLFLTYDSENDVIIPGDSNFLENSIDKSEEEL